MLEENLQLDSTGNNVKILQEKLKILGFFNAIVNGIFGPATEVGVKAFQKEYNLEETGIVDNDMWRLLFELTETAIALYSNMPILSLGSTGEAVRDLQAKLSALLYYTGQVNGRFDLETENAVKRFQYNNDLTTTGVVNNQTWNLIDSLYGNLDECVISGGNIGGDYVEYTVKSGDTLYAIASRYGTTVDEIKRLNNLTSNMLSIGQVLKIPTSDSSGGNNYVDYTVKSGDTLYAIASRYGTTVDEIKRLNNLTSNILSIGQVLRIPTSGNNNVGNYIDYTVKSGDTLYAIANRYGITVDEIKRLNNLTSNTLSVGQVLRIPTSSGNDGDINYVDYTVKSGDTLYAIASRYGTTVDEIKRLNNLTSNTLSIGQILRVPTTTGAVDNYISYIVTRGDTLYAIASRYNTTVDTLKRVNNLTSNTLSVGQILRIPI